MASFRMTNFRKQAIVTRHMRMLIPCPNRPWSTVPNHRTHVARDGGPKESAEKTIEAFTNSTVDLMFNSHQGPATIKASKPALRCEPMLGRQPSQQRSTTTQKAKTGNAI